MTAGLLRACGEALFGPQWHTALARALGMNERTIRRYADGERTMPPAAWRKVWALMVERRATLDHLAAALLRGGQI